MEDLFELHIAQQQLFTDTDRLLVAVSGGLDSVVLCYLLKAKGYTFEMAHCNFGLRGAESDGDEALVLKIAKDLNINCFVQKFDTKKYANEHGVSTQEAARSLRYSWFEQLRLQRQLAYLLTAHHASDNTETIFLNLIRGTGLAGLHGIPQRNMFIVRPLLSFSRQQIQDYATQHSIAWRDDSSNASDAYTRNKIRHHVIPVLKAINPNLDETMRRNIERFSAAEKIVEYYINSLTDSLLKPFGDYYKISLEAIVALPEPQFCLAELLKPYGFNETQINNLLQASRGQAGKQIVSTTHILSWDGKNWILGKKNDASDAILITKEEKYVQRNNLIFEMKPVINSEKIPKLERNEVWVDADKLTYPLCIRTWQNADIFFPLGMKGRKKKISDLLTDAKLGGLEKKKVKVLCAANGDIIWVVGLRADERYSIQKSTESVYCFQINTEV